ncbi:class I SAM-dependent methyltransferase [Nitrosomonas sp.]|uniref:class I SAM-dependent methyltransferase n=1 Tax=Nitrosomonas sp. TaxID=42353 RepID=UPI001DF00914|nr:class I SAM-dependent methyltransferase [Nitrosomonas sp.]MBX3616255.1 class I SAM-dependent methyltransferase [Nitrosomonas sp.]
MTEFVGETQTIDFADPKTKILADIFCKGQNSAPSRLLVVGCGRGIEAAVLSQYLGAKVTGIDIVTNFDPRAALLADLRQGDATKMEFANESFDFVYSFHALEHIPDYRAALAEIHRVLCPGGRWMIGTPNRRRIIGYLGSKDASAAEKLRWNYIDWRAKLQGRFRNELGAHAGYTQEELSSELAGVFSKVTDITFDYYRDLYSKKRNLIDLAISLGAASWLFPCIYFMGRR